MTDASKKSTYFLVRFGQSMEREDWHMLTPSQHRRIRHKRNHAYAVLARENPGRTAPDSRGIQHERESIDGSGILDD